MGHLSIATLFAADTVLIFCKIKQIQTAVMLHFFFLFFRKPSLAGCWGRLVQAAHSLTGPLPALIMQPLWSSMAPSRHCVALQGPFVKQRSRKWDCFVAASLSPQQFFGWGSRTLFGSLIALCPSQPQEEADRPDAIFLLIYFICR